MFIVESYFFAVLLCLFTMLCWGSWANTQKLVQSRWRFELFYWDYVLGIVLISLLSAFTMGSMGEGGRSFLTDLGQGEGKSLAAAFAGGVVFNAANILLTAAIAGAGMAVAFPVGIGIALALGVLSNYLLFSRGNPALILLGVLGVLIAIGLNATAYSRYKRGASSSPAKKWILISALAGILMAAFFPLLAYSMDLADFRFPAAGKLTPYSAFVVFSVAVLLSNLIFNSILMRRPLQGLPISYAEFFKGRSRFHLTGMLGGAIWGAGTLASLLAAGKAGPAISFGLGQGATLVAALWGVFVWKEFRGAGAAVQRQLAAMFLFFLAGLSLLILAGAG